MKVGSNLNSSRRSVSYNAPETQIMVLKLTLKDSKVTMMMIRHTNAAYFLGARFI